MNRNVSTFPLPQNLLQRIEPAPGQPPTIGVVKLTSPPQPLAELLQAPAMLRECISLPKASVMRSQFEDLPVLDTIKVLAFNK